VREIFNDPVLEARGSHDTLTIEHGRGRSASRITFAALAKTVFNLVMTSASTKPICPETSVSFKPLP